MFSTHQCCEMKLMLLNQKLYYLTCFYLLLFKKEKPVEYFVDGTAVYY